MIKACKVMAENGCLSKPGPHNEGQASRYKGSVKPTGDFKLSGRRRGPRFKGTLILTRMQDTARLVQGPHLSCLPRRLPGRSHFSTTKRHKLILGCQLNRASLKGAGHSLDVSGCTASMPPVWKRRLSISSTTPEAGNWSSRSGAVCLL